MSVRSIRQCCEANWLISCVLHSMLFKYPYPNSVPPFLKMFANMGSAQTPAASDQIGQLPSPEELMKLMQELQEQDIQDGQLPEGLKVWLLKPRIDLAHPQSTFTALMVLLSLFQELLNEVKKEQGLAQDTEAEEMTPEPG